jgi:hypothetical protein
LFIKFFGKFGILEAIKQTASFAEKKAGEEIQKSIILMNFGLIVGRGH